MNELEKAEQKIEDFKQQLERANEEYEHLLTQHERLPFKKGEECWLLLHDGDYGEIEWGTEYHTDFFQGNVFKTESEVELESSKRVVIQSVKLFRDKCNKEHANANDYYRYYIIYDRPMRGCRIDSTHQKNFFNPFGPFFIKEDCRRAIELFGKDIADLWGTNL